MENIKLELNKEQANLLLTFVLNPLLKDENASNAIIEKIGEETLENFTFSSILLMAKLSSMSKEENQQIVLDLIDKLFTSLELK